MTGPGMYLCRLHDIADGGARGFDPRGDGRDTVFVVRQGMRLHAYRDDCPHVAGAPMAWRKDAYLNGDGSRIVCSAHGAQFDIASGACTLGPCLGQALARVALAIDGGGGIWVTGDV
ncbi:Rieske 2Fe-2S domain-containing protein [Duganella sp. FT92W]|uniref:Rieske 2Fe-2S domain-containing protein n=1 Tax=Pseudoduganella rivuli TaxID=2666085 RepID=A0A7X2IPG6_9BURK|nr:Rieske (2Fe-2S) protein [Pseudoduganella rivuli]MRV73767.1 Rieske 2Fe-2S domain-containing protein [Pseudoduganella rivuli]